MARERNMTEAGKSFDEETIEKVWKKGKPEPPHKFFRKDVCGASMKRDLHGKREKWGWEIDHIKPVAKGGTDALSNLQPLHWENNVNKGDNYPDWDCKVKA